MEPSLHSIPSYDAAASRLCSMYEGMTTEQVHAPMIDLFPERSVVLDIGSGSGRDASWLASRGNLVVAAEPSGGMLGEAVRAHGDGGVVWMRDAMPRLPVIRSLNAWFDFILLSACWMHIHPCDRAEAMGTISALLGNGGICVITLRHGEPDRERVMHPVSSDEVRRLAEDVGLKVFREDSGNPDRLGRAEVRWSSIALRA